MQECGVMDCARVKFVLHFLIDMANSATSSAKITVNPNVKVQYVQTATSSGREVNLTPTEVVEQGSLLVPGSQEKIREEIVVSPTAVLTPIPQAPISLDWINPRVVGVVIGFLFLWVYVKGLRRK
jgi:hypothetical protein